MTEGKAGAEGAAAGDQRTAEEIRADIEETREELGDTVEELAAKTDVKARAQEKAEGVKADVSDRAHEGLDTARRNPGQVIAVAAIGALAIIWALRRR